jgi:putative DNA primase/helicase
MPLELLQGDGADVRRELARQGLIISPNKKARDLLASFLQVWPVENRARCVDRLGWYGGVFVTPDEAIGQAEEIVVFQNAHAIEPAYSVTGSVEEWRDSVGRLAAGNSRLVFALSVAFAGALADVVGEDSGGFHFRGASSSGKTTVLKVAASVWGNPNTYPRLWRATANGLEGLAALHNDGLLILDELSQLDPKEAGEAAYLLANGQGKARASRTGTARQAARWRLLFLSAGEESLAALMARAGRKVNAGQEIRLADIDADAGVGMGVFEALHDQPTPAALALALKDAATRYHGAVGRAWLRCIVADRAKLADFIAAGIKRFVADVAPKDAAGQVLRVARRFGLVAMAGELASGCDLVGRGYGLTGWAEGEATTAARKCFAAWLEGFGGIGNREERAMLGQVRAFFEAHGASRFARLDDDTFPDDQRIVNRAGFVRTTADGGREFLVLPEVFKREVCAGFDAKAVTRALIEAGWIEPGEGRHIAQRVRVPGLGLVRCYVFTGRMWEGDE